MFAQNEVLHMPKSEFGVGEEKSVGWRYVTKCSSNKPDCIFGFLIKLNICVCEEL